MTWLDQALLRRPVDPTPKPKEPIYGPVHLDDARAALGAPKDATYVVWSPDWDHL